MKTFHMLGAAVTAAALTAAWANLACAQSPGEPPAEPAAPAAEDDSWYRSPAPRKPQPTLAREKAVARGAQRMARLEALRWYGYSNSRPIAAAMPYTSMYSPAWQNPGGRPFAWYTTSRQVFIYPEAPTYR